ncbi:MAG: hypothetical protein HXY50_07705 [Ignavibacteriaceae bacterium]|nr:hypothetical protein [Ignavibacteriaceae bacterium]
MNKAKILPWEIFSQSMVKVYLIDFLIIAIIYFLPALSHLTALPLYYLEPMRLAMLFAMIHTGKKNALIIAATLPIFSLLVSSHPGFLKAILITGELLFNLTFFYLLIRKVNVFSAALLSIIASKLLYYGVKYIFIQTQLIEGGLITTPISIQLIIALLMSIYAGFVFKKSGSNLS